MALNLETTTISLNPDSISQLRMPARYTATWVAVLVVADVFMFILSSYFAGALVDRNWNIRLASERAVHSSVVFILIWLIIFLMLGLYRRSFAPSFRDEFYFTVVALILGVMPQLIVFTAMPWLSTSRLVLFLATLFAIGLVGSTRSLLHAFGPAGRIPTSRILIIGDKARAQALIDKLEKTENFIPVLIARGSESYDLLQRAKASQYMKKVDELRCDRLVLTEMPEANEIYQMIGLARKRDVKLYVPSPSAAKAAAPMQGTTSDLDFAIPSPPPICMPMAKVSKRALDLVLSFPVLAIFTPIMFLAGVLVGLESGFPILYKQARVGRDGSIFNILKFRTMRQDADDTWATPGDSRITRVGSLLRRTSIDELPQLLNVLKGDMSLVGPRPEMISFEEKFAKDIPSYAERRLALPGITGWAQVQMKRNLTPADAVDVLNHDLFYIEHWSLFLDLTVIFKTAVEFLFQRPV